MTTLHKTQPNQTLQQTAAPTIACAALRQAKAAAAELGRSAPEGAPMEFAVEPHRGVGPISFGMTREQVAAAMAEVGGGPPRARFAQTDCFFDYAFQVSFGNAGRADFIEVASHLPGEALFAGRDVFATPADELLAVARQSDQPDPGLSDPPRRYLFPRLILSLSERDERLDRGGVRRDTFGCVGIGGPTYLEAIRKILGG
jgi:hypothetical protein